MNLPNNLTDGPSQACWVSLVDGSSLRGTTFQMLNVQSGMSLYPNVGREVFVNVDRAVPVALCKQ